MRGYNIYFTFQIQHILDFDLEPACTSPNTLYKVISGQRELWFIPFHRLDKQLILKTSWPRSQNDRLIRVRGEFSDTAADFRDSAGDAGGSDDDDGDDDDAEAEQSDWKLQLPPLATLTPVWTHDVSVLQAFSSPPHCHMLFFFFF